MRILSDLIDRVIVDLVSDVIIERINRHQTLDPNAFSCQSQTITVLFTGQAANCYQTILEQLVLFPTNYSFNLVFSDSAYRDLNNKNLSLTQSLANLNIIDNPSKNYDKFLPCDLLLLPELSLNSLTKSVNHIADNIPTEIIQHALMNNISMVVTFDYFYEKQNLSSNYRNHIKKKINTLISFGANVFKLADLLTEITLLKNNPSFGQYQVQKEMPNILDGSSSFNNIKNDKGVISAADVQVHDPNLPIHLSARLLVTPLAMDIIKQKKIQIIKN